MSKNHLIIGNKRYSSWSLRGWLALKFAGMEFTETVVPLRQENTHANITQFGDYPARVPTLLVDDFPIWDSQAILEYVAENAPDHQLWPESPQARARARSICAEMHAGFFDLRNELPMDLGLENAKQPHSDGAESDIQRILKIWRDCREEFGQEGPYLFGRLSMADAVYAPVVSRLRSYAIEVDAVSLAYMEAVWAHPAFVEWRSAAEKESWVIDL